MFYLDKECTIKLDTSLLKEEKVYVNGLLVYRSSSICYRKKVKHPLLVVIERYYDRHKKRWKKIHYFSTDTLLSVYEIVNEYRLRPSIEYTYQDAKALTGFNDPRVHSKDSIEKFLCLSLLAVGILEYLRYLIQEHKLTESQSYSTLDILTILKMHWYHPLRLTRGLIQRLIVYKLFESHFVSFPTSGIIQKL